MTVIMDRKIRKQIIEMLHEIRKGLDYSKASSSAAMLEECIAALQSIRDILAGYLSAARFAVYDEVFSGIIKALQDGVQQNLAGSQLAETVRLLQDLLKYLEALLLKEKEIKKEILFLPYKASMWDSLETIWQAANEDKEHCNAYVVPIPYAERNQDGTAREWHHEIGFFPENVPVIDYHQLDLEKLHPDIIYIHNPYDHRNLVTAVDERFYSYNLKKYTDKLVYVPYCVSGNHVSQGMCETSALQYADHVILESEGIKEQYERYYPYGPVPEGKFLALGSPKYDKVKLAKKENYPLPKAWADLVRGKKVILYATTIHDQLKNYERTIQKLVSILEFFKQRDDVVLWWRPHPLLQNTFDTMLPSICDKYRTIVERYKAEGWGIYDESGDLDCAIAWSDAYYGDGSSILFLYRITQKPIVETDFQIMGDSGKSDLTFTWPCFAEDKVYFVPNRFDYLLSYDCCSGKIENQGHLQHTTADSVDNAFAGVVKNGDVLLAYPKGIAGSEFVEFNLQTKEQKTFSYGDFTEKMDSLKFSRYFSYQGKVFFVRETLPEIAIYDLISKELSMLKIPVDTSIVRQENVDNGKNCTIQADNLLYILLSNSNCVFAFDMSQKTFQKYLIGGNEEKYSCLAIDDSKLCLLNEARNLVLCDCATNMLKMLELPLQDIQDPAVEIKGIYAATGEIFIMLLAKNGEFYAYRVSYAEKKIISRVQLLFAYKITCIENRENKHIFVCGNDDKGTFMGTIDLCSGKKKLNYLELTDEILHEITAEILDRHPVDRSSPVWESVVSLSSLVEYIKTHEVKQEVSEELLAGPRIHKFMLEN